MKLNKKRKLLIVVILISAVLGFVALAPGPIEGCYLEAGDEFNSTAGYSFTYFHAGQVYSCNEYRSNATFFGTYKYEAGTGWVWTLKAPERRICVKPKLLYATFKANDGIPRLATAPFQWRDPRFRKTHRILQSINWGDSTNAKSLETLVVSNLNQLN